MTIWEFSKLSVSDRLIRQEEEERHVGRRVRVTVLMAFTLLVGLIGYLTTPKIIQRIRSKDPGRALRERSAYYALRHIYFGQLQFQKWKFARDKERNPRFAQDLEELLSKGVVEMEFYSLRRDCYYEFEIRLVQRGDGTQGFEALALPNKGSVGMRSFYIDETGVVRYGREKYPSEASPPLQWEDEGALERKEKK